MIDYRIDCIAISRGFDGRTSAGPEGCEAYGSDNTIWAARILWETRNCGMVLQDFAGSRSKGIAKSPYLGCSIALPLDGARIWQSEPSTPRNPKAPQNAPRGLPNPQAPQNAPRGLPNPRS